MQGRRTVDEYYADFLELRNYCASKGSDVEQKVQFLAGLNPELKLEVQKALLQSPKATLDQAVELARSLYALAPKSQPVRAVEDDRLSFMAGRDCYNCGKKGHFSRDCTEKRKLYNQRDDKTEDKSNYKGSDRRGGGAYLSEVTAKRTVGNDVQYQGLWRSKSKAELDWLDEEDVPSHLVEEFDSRALVSALAVGV